MRQAGLSDLHHAARALYTVPLDERSAFCAHLVWQAHVADKYVKRLRRLHAHWGDGSLRAVALPYANRSGGAVDTAGMRQCLAIVLSTLEAPKQGMDHQRVCTLRNCAK